MGAIEGAAARYGEQVYIVERTCMKQGDPVCRFEIRFFASSTASLETPEQVERRREQHSFAQLILSLLPDEAGMTLADLQATLQSKGMRKDLTRPALLLMALRHLHHAGLVATTANHPGDDFTHRRYWRVPTSGPSSQRTG
jgi:hypothetical protein